MLLRLGNNMGMKTMAFRQCKISEKGTCMTCYNMEVLNTKMYFWASRKNRTGATCVVSN